MSEVYREVKDGLQEVVKDSRDFYRGVREDVGDL